MRLRVATLNVWALPWGLARHTETRLALIGEALGPLGADVVAFQEVWSQEARQALRDAGERAGLPHHWHNRGGAGGGGLLVLSRLPVAEARFDPYRLRGHAERVWHGDYWSGKGFALLGLRTPDGPLALVDTHLHARYADQVGDAYRAQRMGQVVQLALSLRGVQVPLVAAGDFNLEESQPQYRVLTGLSRLRDAAREAGAAQPTRLSANPYRGAAAPERIDYVFVRDGASRSVRVRAVERIFDASRSFAGEPGAASDHAGVLADLEVGAARQAGDVAPDPQAIRLAREILEQGRAAWRERIARQRIAGGSALVGGGLALVAARRPALSRRGLLRAALLGAGLLALPAGIAAGALAELAGRPESAAFERLLRELDALERPGP